MDFFFPLDYYLNMKSKEFQSKGVRKVYTPAHKITEEYFNEIIDIFSQEGYRCKGSEGSYGMYCIEFAPMTI